MRLFTFLSNIIFISICASVAAYLFHIRNFNGNICLCARIANWCVPSTTRNISSAIAYSNTRLSNLGSMIARFARKNLPRNH